MGERPKRTITYARAEINNGDYQSYQRRNVYAGVYWLMRR